MKKTAATDHAEPIVYRRIDPNLLVPSPFHRRTRWGDMRLFTLSIKENGVIQSIKCRIPVDDPNALEIVVGHRRHIGACRAGLPFVDVIVVDMTDDEVLEAQYVENADREGAHPLDDADLFDEMKTRGSDERMLAKRFGKKVEFIRSRLRLLNLSPQARKAYANDHLSDLQAQRLAMIPSPVQQNVLCQAIKDGFLSDDDAIAHWIKMHVLAPLDDLPWSLGDKATPLPNGKNGSCNDCPKRTGKQADLFPDLVGGEDMCADTKCWQGKMAHAFKLAVGAAEAAGHTIIDRDAKDMFVQRSGARPLVVKSSGYVDPDAECSMVPGKTWEQVVKLSAVVPERALVRDTDGRPRLLIIEKSMAQAVRAVVRSEPDSAVAKAEAAADPARAQVRAVKEHRAKLEAELVKAVSGIVAGGWNTSLIVRLAAARVVSPSSVKLVAKATNLTPEQILAWEGDGLQFDDMAILGALLVADVGVSSSPHPEIRAIADVFKIELPTTEAAAET